MPRVCSTGTSPGGPELQLVTDLTYVTALSGFVYVALVLTIELNSRAVVGWLTFTAGDTVFVETCRPMALGRRG